MTEAPQLTELQFALMRVLWDRGEATVADIHAAIQPERDLAQTTVATLLSRLARRGVIGFRTVTRQYVYFPLVSEEEIRRAMVKEMTELLFDGDAAELVTHLLASREIAPGDLDRVKALIRARETIHPKENPDVDC